MDYRAFRYHPIYALAMDLLLFLEKSIKCSLCTLVYP